MDDTELARLQDDIESFLNKLKPSQPFLRTVEGTADLQMELRTNELIILVEVWERYDHYDDLKKGDNIRDAHGDLGEFGQMLVEMIEDHFDESVELILEEDGARDESTMSNADKFYIDRITV